MNATETLTQMVTEASRMLPTHNGAGEPLQKRTRVINGHLVQVMVFNFGDRVVVEVDKSTEPLTVAQAVSRLA